MPEVVLRVHCPNGVENDATRTSTRPSGHDRATNESPTAHPGRTDAVTIYTCSRSNYIEHRGDTETTGIGPEPTPRTPSGAAAWHTPKTNIEVGVGHVDWNVDA